MKSTSYWNQLFRLYAFRFSIVFFVFSTSFAELKAQVVIDTINLPSGYSHWQLMYKNVLKVDSSNNVWIGFQRIGAGKFDGSNWTVYDTSNGLPSNNVLSLAFSGTNCWFGTDSGLAKFNGSTWVIYDSSNSGLTNNHVQSLFADGNNLWVGTRSGVFKFDGINWIHYSTANSGLPSDTVNCFTKSGNDTIWIGTNNGLAKFFNGSFTTYLLAINGIIDEPIIKLISDASGNIWIQTIGLYSHRFILYNDSLTLLYHFFPVCTTNLLNIYPLIGLNSVGNIVADNIREFNLNPVNEWSAPVHLQMSQILVTDLDINDKVWWSDIRQWMLHIDYRNALQQMTSTFSDCHVLDVNKVEARILNNGSMFWDLTGQPQYQIPKGSGTNSVFCDGFWIGGLDANNHLHVSAQTYRQGTTGVTGSGNDFWTGPLDTINATIDSATVHRYDSIWKIDRYQINEFNYQFSHGNVTNGTYAVPYIILNWPANGTGNISHYLAPYIDYNNDGIYNPYDGDYPDMKGDQMLWFVYNDNYNIHTETHGKAMGLEIQCSAYAYNCPLVNDSDEAINYTTFYHYRVFNRSDTSYSQVYMGRFTDIDLGNYLDDYVGCDTMLNIAFGYNGDNDDEGITGYGVNPPVQNLLYLSDTITHFTYYNNDFNAMGNPNFDFDYYGYMKSQWKDSSHITYGGNGHGYGPGATNIPTNYMFSGNPYDTTSSVWNETTTGNDPGDRRFLSTTGPFNFPAHSEKDFDFAYVWTRDATHPNGLTTSWAKNVHDVLKVKQWFANDSFPCNNIYSGIQETENQPLIFNMYPNPSAANMNLFVSSKKYQTMNLEVSDVMGRKIRSGIIFSNRNNIIPVESLASGIYFIKVSSKETFTVKKFIKQ